MQLPPPQQPTQSLGRDAETRRGLDSRGLIVAKRRRAYHAALSMQRASGSPSQDFSRGKPVCPGSHLAAASPRKRPLPWRIDSHRTIYRGNQGSASLFKTPATASQGLSNKSGGTAGGPHFALWRASVKTVKTVETSP
jgi:hypothetical protein